MNEASVGTKPTDRSRPTLTRIPFSVIPGQSQLFLDHLSGSPSLAKYFPNYSPDVASLARSSSDVLAQYSTDRSAICDALVDINRIAGAGEKAFTNIDRLRGSDAVAVLTGQQAGLFTGPLYTVYKAMTAIKFAEHLTELGVNAVPIFWAATEDHDLEEVSWASVIGEGDVIARARYDGKPVIDGAPVANVVIDGSISKAVDELIGSLRDGERLRESIEKTWREGTRFGKAFLKQIAEMFEPFGLILADPMNSKLRELSTPIIVEAIENASAINSRLQERDTELGADGYHSQVLVENDYFPAFIFTDLGQRSALKLGAVGSFASKVDKRHFSADELRKIAEETPQRLSPGVMLRPVVQDHLFPTICYIGGGAEIAYFGQNSVVYETLGRRVTPIFHRQSFTIVEPRIRRALEAYGLDMGDLFVGRDELVPRLVEKIESPETAELLANVKTAIDGELSKLDAAFSDIDVTLAAGFAKRRKKIEYHLQAAETKAFAAIMRKSGDADRRLDAIFANLLPNGGLQEREINVLSYLARYGESFLRTVYHATDVDERDHILIDI
ncbi:MAG: bacillithiol biosynthesis cysteine-adding enzyme BshC [Blastocatellia bacterium]|nr:bacillithiol biosynthesis cysteine-adding enzyme BshC [Blastocatellia bacterium]